MQLPKMMLGCIAVLQDKNLILDELRETFKDDILDIHEFHLWCLVPPTTFATLHVIFKDEEVGLNPSLKTVYIKSTSVLSIWITKAVRTRYIGLKKVFWKIGIA